jgi:hypothetical protein
MQPVYNGCHGNQDVVQLFTQRVLYKGGINHDKTYEYQHAQGKKAKKKNICIKTQHIGMVTNYRN